MSAAYTAGAAIDSVPGRRWSLRWALLGGLVAVAAVGLGRPLLLDRGAAPAVDTTARAAAAALAAFREATDPLVKEGGQVVAMGLKPGVADVANQAFGQDVLLSMASGWAAELDGLRAEMAEVPAPGFLAEAHFFYVECLEGYATAARALHAAAGAADPIRRDELIDLAADLGTAADRLYDRAQAVIERHEARLRPNDEE
jgi:hypothetical protein